VTFSTDGLQFVDATDSVDSTINGEAATDVGGTAPADGGLPVPKLKSGCGCGSTAGSSSVLVALLALAALGARRRFTAL
jgi:MYXO-CTERM domain-containing protein